MYFSRYVHSHRFDWPSALHATTKVFPAAALLLGHVGIKRLPNVATALTSVEWERGEWPGQRGWRRPDTEALPVAAATAGAQTGEGRKVNRLPASTRSTHLHLSAQSVWKCLCVVVCILRECRGLWGRICFSLTLLVIKGCLWYLLSSRCLNILTVRLFCNTGRSVCYFHYYWQTYHCAQQLLSNFF